MPSRLEELQRRFVSAVTTGDASLAAAVRGGGALSPEDAVAVYRRAYPARLTEALGEVYPRVWRVLGDRAFFAACAAFIAKEPSRSHNLADYGRGFPGHLDRWDAALDAPFLGDLARLELAFHDLFHAPQHEGLDPAVLARDAATDARFLFGPATALVSSSHRVHSLWSRDLADDSPVEPESWRGKESVFMYKREGIVHSLVLDAAQAAVLSGLRDGAPLERAIAAAEGADADAVASLFHRISDSRAVVEVSRAS
jgi:hypothetical protein